MSKSQTVQGLINSRLEEYETRKKYGFRYAVFIEELRSEGIEISADYFGLCMRKARKLALADAKKNHGQMASNLAEKKPVAVTEKEPATATAPEGNKFQFTGTGNPEELI